MSSLAVSGIAPFLDFAGLLMFIEKISIYLLIGGTFYFSRNTDPSARDTTFNEILANRDARFLTELTDYRDKFDSELTLRDENFTAEIQRILTMLNTSTVRLDEIEQVLQNYHNNFGRVATEFESINTSIVTLQSEINQRYAMVLRTEEIEFDQQSMMSQASNYSAGQASNHSTGQASNHSTGQASNHSAGQASNHSSGQASNHSSASSGQLTFTGISLTVWEQFKRIFDQIKTQNNYTLEEMCLSVAMDICLLGGNIKKTTVQGFYERNIKKKDGYISTLDQIGLWIDSKTNNLGSE